MKMTQSGKEHFDKFITLAENAGVTLPALSTFNLSSISGLLEKYKQDENLNNIPIDIFDRLYFNLPPMEGKAPFYGACIYKNLLIKLLIDKGLLNTNIAISNRFIMAIQEAKHLNNWLDCDVIQDAISQALKLRDNNNDQARIKALDYLTTSVNYRLFSDKSRANYFNRLVAEFKELITE